MRRPIASALAVALLATACSDDDERALEPLDTPTFADEPADTTPPDSATASGNPAVDSPPDPTTVDGTVVDGPTATAAATTTIPLERVAFDDPVGDATPGIGASAPPGWSDLAGAVLERRGNAFRLGIRLGETAPRRAPGSETMNIASFYDIDGDGDVDFEIWVNLDGDGWGPAWYDNRGGAAFGDDTEVTVETAGDTVSLLFPASRLRSPDRLQFSLASEYGDLTAIGSSFARRDDAPDDDRAVRFP